MSGGMNGYMIHEWLQDEMIELGEKEAIEAVADKEAAETAAHVALMKEANLEVKMTLPHLVHGTCMAPELAGLT